MSKRSKPKGFGRTSHDVSKTVYPRFAVYHHRPSPSDSLLFNMCLNVVEPLTGRRCYVALGPDLSEAAMDAYTSQSRDEVASGNARSLADIALDLVRSEGYIFKS